MSTRERIDWTRLLERQKKAEQDTLAVGSLEPDYRNRILQQRAAMLATVVQDRQKSDSALSVVVFSLGDDRYAIPLSKLVEVVRAPKLATVPHASPMVAGLIQVRGEIRPVYHLPLLLGHEQAITDVVETVLLVRHATGEFGIGADSVEDIREVPPEGRKITSVAAGHVIWTTEDLIPCLSTESLIPEQING